MSGYQKPRKNVAILKPIYDDLQRLKAEHGGELSLSELINHLILEHDIAQDRRLERGRRHNMAKALLGDAPPPHTVRIQTSRGWFDVPDDEYEAEMKRGPVESGDIIVSKLLPDAWLMKGVEMGLVVKAIGKPFGSKDTKPRIRRRKLPLKVKNAT